MAKKKTIKLEITHGEDAVLEEVLLEEPPSLADLPLSELHATPVREEPSKPRLSGQELTAILREQRRMRRGT